MVYPALALFYFVSFSWLSYAQTSSDPTTANVTSSVSATGLKLDLNYKNLVASITKSSERLVLYDWVDVVEEIIKDATSEPFSSVGHAPRYDRWPLLTTDVYDIPQRPSFAIRFSLTPAAGCPTRLVSKGLLEAVAGMFQQFTTLPGGLNVEFSGTIDLQNTPLYQFRLINVNQDVAASYRSQESLTREDVGALAKDTNRSCSKLSRTICCYSSVQLARKFSLCLPCAYVVPSEEMVVEVIASLLYYTMNTPSEGEQTRRNAWLVPADFPRQWSRRQRLDVLHAHPTEYAAYKANVLKPAFDSFRRRMIGKSRVIFIGHWGANYLIPNVRDVISDLKLWTGQTYAIDIYGEGETPATPPRSAMNPLTPINIGSPAERRRMSGRNIPAVIPFYPYYYWDVMYTSVPWKDEFYGRRIADAIRNGEGPSHFLDGVGNSTAAKPQLTSRSINRLHARQLQGTNATVPIPKPDVAPDDDKMDTDPLYDEDPVQYPNIASQACVVGEPAVLAAGSGTANSSATGTQSGDPPSPAGGIVPVNVPQGAETA